MGYRDPLEALQAENESLQQQLKEAQDEAAALRDQKSPSDDGDRHRWALGMRCLGGVAMMLPFLLMTAVCEHRVAPRTVRAHNWAASVQATPTPMLVSPTPTPVRHSCRMLAGPATGFEHFTASIERSARVIETTGVRDLSPGNACTVRVAPVHMAEFNCHVEVVCQNGQTLYGALPTGYAHCDVDRRMGVTRAADAEPTAVDGDGAFTLDMIHQRMVVTDGQGAEASRTVLSLDAPPSVF